MKAGTTQTSGRIASWRTPLSPRNLLAIPVFNEQTHLLAVLREARRHIDDILVIDDGSTDDTPKLLSTARSVAVIRHPENRGYGASLASAFQYAIDRDYDWLITMDCDRQHEPALIPTFLSAARSDRFDLISGSRYLHREANDDAPPPDRRLINARITEMLNLRLGLDITDAFCGFKAYRVSALRCLHITVPGYAMPMQFWVQAKRANWRITEIPVRLIYNDPTRHFGGLLDDPDSRYQHYLDVFEAEMAVPAREAPCSRKCGATAA